MSLLNKFVVATLPLVPKFIVGKVSQRYIAGITLADALSAISRLNARGYMATLDLLGEDVTERSETERMRSDCIAMFEEIDRRKLDSNVSLKPTQLGLRISREVCYENIRPIVERAWQLKDFVRIDMEDSTTTDDTLEIYRQLRREGFGNVGVVIQAYLHRSEADVRELVKMKANIRLCKGIYVESPDIAFKEREEIQRNFALLLRIILESGCYAGIATHDEYLVEKSYELIQRMQLTPQQYEFQMLLGVREQLRESILKRGHRLRVYVPYGERWYDYSVRRLTENPQLAGYVFKAVFKLNHS